jgi:CCR4-NOT transcription complex subunit 1
VFLLKFCVDATRVRVFSAFLQSYSRLLLRDADRKKSAFNQRPYFRVMNNLLQDVNAASEPALEILHPSLWTILAHTLHVLAPSRAPSFCFAWLELVSHRQWMPKMLASRVPEFLSLFQRLLVDMFQFLEPFLKSVELPESIRLLYKGTLRVLLVLLHDFPEFLCEYHMSFCDALPQSCIQMRNLILSAFPRNMRLPDPFTPNLKVDKLVEISQAPRLLVDVLQRLAPLQLKSDLDFYLQGRTPAAFLTDLPNRVLLDAPVNGSRYNVTVLNALVVYVGIQGSKLQNQVSAMEVFQALMAYLDAEGRYLVLNAIANQLRYPNSHTHYFSCTLLGLFADAPHEAVQEQITRVLLERLIVHRPHPWGLLITFIELIKNPRYDFWNQRFTHCAPEIERLFESVARSCMSGASSDDASS